MEVGLATPAPHGLLEGSDPEPEPSGSGKRKRKKKSKKHVVSDLDSDLDTPKAQKSSRGKLPKPTSRFPEVDNLDSPPQAGNPSQRSVSPDPVDDQWLPDSDHDFDIWQPSHRASSPSDSRTSAGRKSKKSLEREEEPVRGPNQRVRSRYGFLQACTQDIRSWGQTARQTYLGYGFI